MASKTEPKEQTLVQQLERERDSLKHGLWRQRRRPSGIAGYALLALGVLFLALSIIYSSASSAIISALIGLGLAFWGCVLLYITPSSFVRSTLLDSTAISSLATINKIITELNYEGKGIYLPPTYLRGVKGGTVFIPTTKKIIIPPIQEIAEDKVFLKNPGGICLTPLGLGLANLYEKELGKDFAKTNLDYIQKNLPKVFIEGLQIAEDLEIESKGNKVQAKITGSIYKDLCKQVEEASPGICSKIGCPLCSSIALAITRSTRRPLVIQEVKPTSDGDTVEAEFRLLGRKRKQTAKKKKPAENTKPDPDATNAAKFTKTHSNLAALILFISGSALLIVIGGIILNEAIITGKTLSLIIFGSALGESQIPGIGPIIYVSLLAGMLLILLSLLTYLLRRGRP